MKSTLFCCKNDRSLLVLGRPDVLGTWPLWLLNQRDCDPSAALLTAPPGKGGREEPSSRPRDSSGWFNTQTDMTHVSKGRDQIQSLYVYRNPHTREAERPRAPQVQRQKGTRARRWEEGRRLGHLKGPCWVTRKQVFSEQGSACPTDTSESYVSLPHGRRL